MCGIFGAFAETDRVIDEEIVWQLAESATTRGRHSHGLAWVDPGGSLRRYKALGPMAVPNGTGCRPSVMRSAIAGQAVIGHARYATRGRRDDITAAHPHPTSAGWLIHNGTVRNADALRRRYNLFPVSDCDSEVLAGLVDCFGGSLLSRVTRAAASMSGGNVFAGLWRGPTRMVIARRGKPLYCSRWLGVWYFCSLPDRLPGTAYRVHGNTARVLQVRDGKLSQTVNGLPSPDGHAEACPLPERKPVIRNLRVEGIS